MDRINTAFMYVSAKCHHGFYDDLYSSPRRGAPNRWRAPFFLPMPVFPVCGALPVTWKEANRGRRNWR